VTSSWKSGFEIELLAPAGLSRADLAEAIAARGQGRVAKGFYPQSEPSLAPGIPVFENLILSFEALDSDEKRIALCVDDLTIKADLNRNAPQKPGWLRLLSNDARLLALATRHCSPDAPLSTVLEPLAELFGTSVQTDDSGLFKVLDSGGRPVAMAAGLPGERERPCEIITAPLTDNRNAVLEFVLGEAIRLGFTIPEEAAVHVHFDAEKLCSGHVLSRLIGLLHIHGAYLRHHVRTNPACVRLGPVADNLVELAKSERFVSASWEDARKMLISCKPTKYCDFNFSNIAYQTPDKHTFEVRIFPGSMDAGQIAGFADLFTGILEWAADPESPDFPSTPEMFISV
jgi:hypothetical protein